MAAHPAFPQLSFAESQRLLDTQYPISPLLPGANVAVRATYLVAVENRLRAIQTVRHIDIDLAAASQYAFDLKAHLAAFVAGM